MFLKDCVSLSMPQNVPLVFNVNLYDIKECDGWIENKYCETTKELQKLNDEVLTFLDCKLE